MQTCECLLVRQELVELFSAVQHQKATDIMVNHLMFLNPAADRMRMLNSRKFGEDSMLVHWNLSCCKINQLPELFSTLVCTMDLYLNVNNLQSLPESFGNITVGRNLYLGSNQKLDEVPHSFPNVKGTVSFRK